MSVALYAVPTKPSGKEVVVIFNGAAIVIGSDAVVEAAGDCESVTLKVSGVIVAVVGGGMGINGLPPITPVLASSKSPDGSVPLLSVQA